jgi:hypothetical protein
MASNNEARISISIRPEKSIAPRRKEINQKEIKLIKKLLKTLFISSSLPSSF